MSIFEKVGHENYLSNTIWLFLDRVLRSGLSLLIVFLMARYLGPENYGKYAYITSYVAIAIAFCMMGIDVILVKEVRQSKLDAERIINQAFILKLFWSSVVLTVALFINMLLNDAELRLLVSLGLLGVFFYLLTTIDVLFQASVSSKLSSIAQISAAFISAALKLLLIILEVSPKVILSTVAIDSILLGMAYVVLWRQYAVSRLSFLPDPDYIWPLFRRAMPLMVVTVSAIIYTKIDQIMLKQMVGLEELAEYAAAVKVVEVFYLFPLLITQSLFPKLVDNLSKSRSLFFISLTNQFRLMWTLGVSLSAILWFAGDDLVEFIFGEAFRSQENIAGLLGLSVIAVSVGSLSTKVYYALGKESLYMVRSILGVFVNIIFNLLLIPEFGAAGAVYATLITLFSIHFLFNLVTAELRSISMVQFHAISQIFKVKL